jgi:hypothetical protein
MFYLLFISRLSFELAQCKPIGHNRPDMITNKAIGINNASVSVGNKALAKP